jgi:molecular chaperone DnaK (HSP70)
MGAKVTDGAGPAIGIDLGTTYSCVAVWRPSHNRVEIIANDQGNFTTPSCVAFTDTCRLVGDAAVNHAAMNPVNTIFGENHKLTSVILHCQAAAVCVPWFSACVT